MTLSSCNSQNRQLTGSGFFRSFFKLLFLLPALQKVASIMVLPELNLHHLFILVWNILPTHVSVSKWEQLIKSRICLGVTDQLCY